MQLIVILLKFILVAFLSIFYWPLNALLHWVQKPYHRLQKTDKISFWLATPFYYILFGIVVVFSMPLEVVSQNIHPM